MSCTASVCRSCTRSIAQAVQEVLYKLYKKCYISRNLLASYTTHTFLAMQASRPAARSTCHSHHNSHPTRAMQWVTLRAYRCNLEDTALRFMLLARSSVKGTAEPADAACLLSSAGKSAHCPTNSAWQSVYRKACISSRP